MTGKNSLRARAEAAAKDLRLKRLAKRYGGGDEFEHVSEPRDIADAIEAVARAFAERALRAVRVTDDGIAPTSDERKAALRAAEVGE